MPRAKYTSGRTLVGVTVAVLALAVGLLLAQRLILHPSTDIKSDAEQGQAQTQALTSWPDPALTGNRRQSVAVLPFPAVSNGPDDDYFAAGLTEELCLQLARFQELRVFGHHTSLWIGEGEDPLPAAREIGARYLVRGSVRRHDGRARVAAHLIDAGDGAELWAESYERPLTPEGLRLTKGSTNASRLGSLAALGVDVGSGGEPDTSSTNERDFSSHSSQSRSSLSSRPAAPAYPPGHQSRGTAT